MSLETNFDVRWMEAALSQAQNALRENEVPIGAVVVHQNRIVGRGHNRIEALQDATAHAEILAISSASNTLGTWRLNECDLFVTIEPCMMCCGAMLLSRVKRLVYGAADPRFGACVSSYQLLQDNKYRQQIIVESGILEQPCAQILQEFFRQIRRRSKK